MAALTRQSPQQFLVRFGELARARRGEIVQVDPFLIARALAEVMKACTVRSANGRPLLWNEYRVVLSRADFEPIAALQGPLERDIDAALAREAGARDADLVGELRVTIVADEADELGAGEGVVRAAFVPTERLVAPGAGQLTIRLDARAIARPRADGATVHVADTLDPISSAAAAGVLYDLRWTGGSVAIACGLTVILGRAHPDPPPMFVALDGASPRINKEQLHLTTMPASVRIARPEAANPVHVDGRAVPPGGEIEATAPLEISLSKGDLVIAVRLRSR